MFNINVIFKDKNKFSNIQRFIEKLDKEGMSHWAEIQDRMNDLANESRDEMRKTISTSKKRKSFGSNLEDAIETELLETTGELVVGVGNVDKLKTDAPYFEVLDQGGYVPYSTRKGAPLGSFEGDAPALDASASLNWERSGNKGFFMKPKKAISPVGYVRQAVNFAEKQIDKFLKDIGTIFINAMRV